MEKETIINYLDNYPEVVYDGIDRDISRPNHIKGRKLLLNATDEIQRCVFWLVEFYKPNKSLRNLKSSLQIKFYVEKYFGKYISNGSFIAAVKILGYDYREFQGDIGIYLSFNKVQLRRYREKYFKR
jgi:hypothetical protein